MKPLRSIVEMFKGDPSCPICHGDGYVCENHPKRPWPSDDCCGGAGMPCECTPGGKLRREGKG